MRFHYTKHAIGKFKKVRTAGFPITKKRIQQIIKSPLKNSYDKESDILAITISKKPFDYAEEMGDFIVHFDKKNKPVYVEILNANRFLSDATTVLPDSSKQEILRHLRSM